MSAISNSYSVFKESLSIIGKDKILLIYPVLAGITSFIAAISFILPLALGLVGSFYLLSVMIFYLVIYFISIFFSSALMIAAELTLKGGKPTVSDGLKGAWSKADNILLWSLFSATVGVALKAIERMTRGRYNILESMFGIAWSLAIFFAVPVMIFEDKTPIDALKRSSQLFKKTWGESLTGRFGVNFYIFLLVLAGLAVTIFMSMVIPSAVVCFIFLFLAYFMFLFILGSALTSVYVTALYHYATTGEVKGGFSEATIKRTDPGAQIT